MENSNLPKSETTASNVTVCGDLNSDVQEISTQANKTNRSLRKLPVQPPNHKAICDQPAYLFWKIQSRLAKLTHRLRQEKRIMIDSDTNDVIPIIQNPSDPIQDKG